MWETDDGLPHNSIASVVQRRDGFLWIATQGGLVRFDGLQFTGVESPLIHGVKSSNVVALAQEDAETLLVATIQSGLLRLRQGEVTPHPLSVQMDLRNRIFALLREDDHVFWVVFFDKEAWRWRHGKVEKFPPPAGLRPFWSVSSARDEHGAFHLSRGAGIERYESGVLSPVGQSLSTAVVIAPARHEGIWVANGRRVSKLIDDKTVTVVHPPPWSGVGTPTALHEDNAGALWIATTEQGLVRWQDGVATSVATSHLKIGGLHEDDEGNLWAATAGGGLNRVQRTRLSLLAADSDWADTVAGTVCEDSEGNLWFANRRILRKVTAGRAEPAPNEKHWPKRVVVIAPDAAGHVWFGVGPDLWRGKVDGSAPPTLLHTGDTGSIHVIFRARDGSMWIGGNNRGVRRYFPDGTMASFDAAQGLTALPGNGIRAIHGDAQGNLWLGTAGGGVLLRREGKVTPIAAPQGLPDEMDIQLPGLNGIECTRRLKQVLPGTQVLVFTVFMDSDQIFKALAAGASGYLHVRSRTEAVIKYLR